jgi:hypothetical protein
LRGQEMHDAPRSRCRRCTSCPITSTHSALCARWRRASISAAWSAAPGWRQTGWGSYRAWAVPRSFSKGLGGAAFRPPPRECGLARPAPGGCEPSAWLLQAFAGLQVKVVFVEGAMPPPRGRPDCHQPARQHTGARLGVHVVNREPAVGAGANTATWRWPTSAHTPVLGGCLRPRRRRSSAKVLRSLGPS